ncbi:cilia- and flagella-associated protein 107 isoform X2 [Cetorhinus maximus]
MASICPLPLVDRFSPDPLGTLPSWKPLQRYQNRVLLGNWVEEREKFIKGTCFGTTTYRADYKPYPYVMPDVRENVMIQKRHQGIPLSVFFTHHNIPHSWYYVTHYDEHFNRRPNPCLPPLRKWNMKRLSWVPETADYPLIVSPIGTESVLPMDDDSTRLGCDLVYSHTANTQLPGSHVESGHLASTRG